VERAEAEAVYDAGREAWLLLFDEGSIFCGRPLDGISLPGPAGRVPSLSARQAKPTVQVGTGSDHRDRRRLELHHRGRWSEASGVMPPNAGSELERGR
jgi:hypothetical protein